MTALAGCFGAISRNLNAECDAVLRALRPYGSQRARLASLSGATFGFGSSGDLTGARPDDQPLIAAGRFLLVADIRLDNRAEVAEAIGSSSGISDAEILLDAWLRWGEHSLDHLTGDFAFALFDAAERTLTLARDPTGQRPLFFVQTPEFGAFASMPSALLSCPRPRRGLQFERMAAMLRAAVDTSSATDFAGVFRVLPGHVAKLSMSGVAQTPYWQPPRTFLRLSDDDYVLAYREQLDAAVEARLRRRGPLGVQLSSGWDSSAVAATAATISADKPIAFTGAPRAGFDGPVPRGRIADEAKLASLTARMHRMPHEVVRPEGDPLALLQEHARLYQNPDRNVVNMQWWSAVHRAARDRGISVMLTGQLGNLTLHSAGLWLLAEWVRSGSVRRWWAEARAAARQADTRWRGVLVNSFGEWIPDMALLAVSRLVGNTPAMSIQSFVRPEWHARADAYARDTRARMTNRRSYAERLSWIRMQDVGMFRLGALAETGVEERDPMADRRLIDFSFRLPPDQLIRDGARRPLARWALSDRIPSGVLDFGLRGYQGADWFERVKPEHGHAMIEHLRASHAASELLDLDKMHQAFASWPATGASDPSTRITYRTRLLGALSTGVFAQEFERESSADSV